MLRFKPLAAALLAASVATSALATVEQVSAVDVTADLSAIQNEKAAAYWANLEKDLEAAIGGRLVGRMGEKGAIIDVDIREVELANAFERELNLADAVLTGLVKIRDEGDHGNDDTYELSVTLQNSNVALAEGQTLMLSATDTPETYQRLVDTFADGVVARLK